MSNLRKYRRPSAENLTRQYATKLPDQLADEFEQWCRELNITPSEALRLLVVEEMAAVKRMKDTQSYPEITNDTEKYPAATLEITSVISREPKPRPKRPASGSLGRLTTTQWEIDGFLPCPVCRKWGAAKNFKRDHITDHGLPFDNKGEFLHHPDYKPIVEQMYQERLAIMDK